ncbi:MAG: phosphoenolpyruvate--protein phosphotransferase, partial [Erysipelotrichales bacterium]|nr:phosphoenolpyruvate--protein phosphotransferase [Erysipelotrichales bacterium]
MLKGIAASAGVAIAKVFKLETPVLTVPTNRIEDVDAEIARFNAALEKTMADIEDIKDRAEKAGKLKPEELEIFDAHLMMAQDPELKDSIEMQIQDGDNAVHATDEVAKQWIAMFESMVDNEYMQARAADVKDVTFRLRANLLGIEIPDLGKMNEDSIVVAEDLTPSDTAQLNSFAKGFVTELGGRTSHSAIMARSLEIPAVVGTEGILKAAKAGDILIMDALKGEVFLNPSEEEIAVYRKKAADYIQYRNDLKVLKDAESITTDGHKVDIVGNIGTPKDADGVLANGGEGVGLYRTEFLYMNSQALPTEEEQFEAYKEVLEKMAPHPVVVRTLDIGGDKALPYLPLDPEMNPFLGYRAIRLCLDRKDIFRTQLRALLRASAYGKLRIMFPMIATLNEFRAGKQVYEEEKAKLLAEGVAVSDDIEVGMMVEIPASAVLADQFGKEADFFSIGTNDLIQYSMASDRGNQKVAYLYQPLNPSLLRLIKMAIDGAHKNGKWCGMCGEMAGDPISAPVLLGLGLDEFSMSATSILPARKMINSLSYAEMKEVAAKA